MRSFISTLFSAALALASTAPGAPDARYALVGTGGKALAQKIGVPYYAIEGNYGAPGSTFHSVDSLNDPPAGHQVLRKVAKLNVRNDSLGQSNAEFEAALTQYVGMLALWHIAQQIGPKPTFAWLNPDPAKLAAAESLQIIATIRREKARVPAITGTVWEIGNEPNLFPAITPERYAAIYARYHAFIKREDPSAKVALGPVFVRETGVDLLPRMRSAVKTELDAVFPPLLPRSLFNAIEADLWETLSARILAMGTIDYFDRVFAALDTSIRPDIVSLHVYPFEDRAPFLTDLDRKRVLDSIADTLTARAEKRGAAAPIWITEFGNVNPALTEEQAAAQASALIDAFAANPKFQKWFYYKGTGFDAQLAGVPGMSPPLTRLLKDSTFEPADGNFPCSRFNAIGRMYYQRASGSACNDGTSLRAPLSRTKTAFTLSGSTLNVTLAEDAEARIRVYDLSGNLRATSRKALPAGASRLALAELFRDSDLRKGAHFVELSLPALEETLFQPWTRD